MLLIRSRRAGTIKGAMFRTIADVLEADIDLDFDGDFVNLIHPIAHCSETNRVSAITSTILRRFDRTMEFGWFHEMGFKVDIIDLSGRSRTIESDDRNYCREFIPNDARLLARRLVELSYVKLIREIEPRTIFRRTTISNSIHAAMAKHHSLTAVIENEGYDIVDADTDGNGQLYWVMERIVPYSR
jgi:hypothetical protein